MKKGIFLIALSLIGAACIGQNIQKGSLLGIHASTAVLKPGVSMQDYVKFYIDTAIPQYEKAFTGVKMYLLKAISGQDSSSMSVMFVFKSEDERNKYFNNDGTMTNLGNAANEKLKDLYKEMEKYETASSTADKYTDWIVQ